MTHRSGYAVADRVNMKFACGDTDDWNTGEAAY